MVGVPRAFSRQNKIKGEGRGREEESFLKAPPENPPVTPSDTQECAYRGDGSQFPRLPGSRGERGGGTQ